MTFFQSCSSLTKKGYKISMIALCLCSFPVFAETICQTLPPAIQSITQENTLTCENIIKTCPKKGPYYEENCVAEKIKKEPLCEHLGALADYLSVSPSQLSLLSYPLQQLITVHYPADGQDHYYLLSAQGCLIDTALDPRTLDPAIKKQYANQSWMISNTQAPLLQKLNTGNTLFDIPLNITDHCLACQVIGTAHIGLTFTPAGTLFSSQLLSFTTEKPAATDQ